MGGRGGSSGGGGGGGAAAPNNYQPWTDENGEPLPEMDQHTYEVSARMFSGSSLGFRRAIQGDEDWLEHWELDEEGSRERLVKRARQFDNYLAKGEYDGMLYRGLRMDPEAAKALQPGMLINHNGMASFTKSESTATDFSTHAPGTGITDGQRVLLVLEGGTRAGRDISPYSMYKSEDEVTLASCSHMRITKVYESGGHVVVHGTEEIHQYDPNVAKGHGPQVVR